MKILVTGASGFVGGSFIRQFSGRDDMELFGVARSNINQANYTSIDLSSEFDLPISPDIVVHAAARASPWGKKSDYQSQNIDVTKEVIRFCERKNLPKLIYLSSSSVFYQNKHQLNITEDSPIGPEFVNDYAATKFAGEQLVKKYSGKHVILRPRAVFGPYDTVLFPRILAAARKGRLPLFETQGSPVIGDLIYIDVLCDYILKAALNLDLVGEYNLTNAEPVEIQSFLLQAFDKLGLTKPSRTVKVSTAMKAATLTEFIYKLFRLPWEPPVTRFGINVLSTSKTFNVEKMLRDFGPPIFTIEQGLEKFIEWQKNND